MFKGDTLEAVVAQIAEQAEYNGLFTSKIVEMDARQAEWESRIDRALARSEGMAQKTSELADTLEGIRAAIGKWQASVNGELAALRAEIIDQRTSTDRLRTQLRAAICGVAVSFAVIVYLFVRVFR